MKTPAGYPAADDGRLLRLTRIATPSRAVQRVRTQDIRLTTKSAFTTGALSIKVIWPHNHALRRERHHVRDNNSKTRPDAYPFIANMNTNSLPVCRDVLPTNARSYQPYRIFGMHIQWPVWEKPIARRLVRLWSESGVAGRHGESVPGSGQRRNSPWRSKVAKFPEIANFFEFPFLALVLYA